MQTASSFFWPSPILWLGLALLAIVDCLWLLAIGGSVELHNASLEIMAIGLFVSFAALRYSHNVRLRAAASGLSFVFLAWPVLRLFNHLVMTTALPLQDALLARGDAALGLDWVSYLQMLEGHFSLLVAMSHCYTSLTTVSCITFALLVFLGDVREAAAFLILFFWAAILASSIGLLFPAEGAMIFYAPSAAMLQVIPLDSGTWFVEPLRMLRENTEPVFKMAYMPGLTAFPSFHTAMGVIILYCTRTRSYLFAPALVFVTLMILSTPVFGGHYFVDLFAGIALAVALIYAVRHSSRAKSAPVSVLLGKVPAE